MFRDSAVENLTDFFRPLPPAERRRQRTELNAVVAEAECLMHGVEPADLRANTGVSWLRDRVREGLAGVAEALDPLVRRRPPTPRAADAAVKARHTMPEFLETQDLYVRPDGTARGLYGELLDADALGHCTTVRASHVEPAPGGGWTADLSPSGGPALGPYPLRSAALAAEADWLTRRRLAPPG